jgi:hypothetical protein
LQLTNLTIQQAHASNVPVSSTASASEEANRISSLICDDFFCVSNIACIGFFRPDGTPVSVSLEPYDRVAPSFSFLALANPLRAACGSLVIADHNNRDQAL